MEEQLAKSRSIVMRTLVDRLLCLRSNRSMPHRAAFHVLSALVVLVAAPAARAATYTVGAGKTYANLGAVASLLNPGDLVLVDGDQTYPSVLFTRPGTAQSPITIRGVRVNGRRPVLSGGFNTIELQGNYYVFEGFEVTAGSFRCIYHHAHGITIRDVV